MDKTTKKVIRYLARHSGMHTLEDISEVCGPDSRRSIDHLVSIGYVKQKHQQIYTHGCTHSVPCDQYEITAGGVWYLKDSPWATFDKWLTRICAVVGAITGIVALISE